MVHSPEAAAKAPSPYFAGTKLQFAWDQTSVGLLMECPFKYKLSILEGWRKKNSSFHLLFGGWYATAIETYYKLRHNEQADHDDALDAVVADALASTWMRDKDDPADPGFPWQPPEGETKKTRENLIRTIIWYFEAYKDDDFEVLIVDGKPAVELLFTFESGLSCDKGPFLFTGHLDSLRSFDDTTYVMDQKTTGGAIGSYYFAQFDLDNQMSQYTFAGNVCFNIPVKGVVIDAAQIMVGFTAFGRGITTRSASQLQEWHANVGAWLKLAEQFEASGHYPMNLKSCNNYAGCQFKGVCSKSPDVREHFLKTDFERQFWNPLAVR